ncbi:MAG: hypothetical protein RMI79_05090 [Nitrososphaerota archaeon]|nr:hypothetical protein [Nitrososphaerota archaeon]
MGGRRAGLATFASLMVTALLNLIEKDSVISIVVNGVSGQAWGQSA